MTHDDGKVLCYNEIMESDEEYNRRYQHEIKGKSQQAAPKKITKASFIKMVKAGEIPGWSWIDASEIDLGEKVQGIDVAIHA